MVRRNTGSNVGDKMTERICNQHTVRDNRSNMKKTSIVVAITLVTMVAEIVYGLITGSMALLADGIHMGTHTFALVVTVIAYYIAGKHANNPNFAFSSGKVGILGGYTNAIILGITALYMVNEAIHRLLNPETIIFNQALLVAAIGLTVNVVSAFLLSSGGDHHHHGDHEHHNHEHHHDHNLRAAYIHVITDAMTSILAIIALLIGKFFGQTWPDALVAILGAIVILKWAYGLLISSGRLLVDYHPVAKDNEKLQSIVNETGSIIKDLHIWKTSENCKAIILELEPGELFNKDQFLNDVKEKCKCNHITLDIKA